MKGIVAKGAGSGVLKDIQLMTRAHRRGGKSTSLPVTVKTSLGWDDNTKNIEEVAEAAGRWRESAHHPWPHPCQMYKAEADGSLIAKVKNNPRIHIPIFGNGDIDSPQKRWNTRTGTG